MDRSASPSTEMSLIHGDCLDVMAAMEPGSVDAIVCDPPYGLGFMGKAWDDAGRLASRPPSALHPLEGTAEARGAYPRTGKGPAAVAFDGRAFQEWSGRWAEAAYRVAKPSAYLLAFGGTRTVHRMTCAIEDAGWIVRDMLVWGYASGFPKSKASLKPAWEPIVMARKPGPLRMLAIDACRIPTEETWEGGPTRDRGGVTYGGPLNEVRSDSSPLGRWPANIVLTDPIFDGGIEGVVGGGEAASGGNINGRPVTGYGGHWADSREFDGYQDSGSYSRFFILPKADRADREPVLGGLSGLEPVDVFRGHQPDNPKCLTCGRQRIGPLGAPACECDEPDWAVSG